MQLNVYALKESSIHKNEFLLKIKDYKNHDKLDLLH